MVLILVDGKSTVSDLILKIGNPLLTESALAELEEGGFIAPRVEQDSLWSESKKVAQEIRSAALSKATQIVSPAKPAVPEPEVEPLLSISPDSAFSDSAFPFPPMPFSNTDRPQPPLVKEKESKQRKPGVKASDVFGRLSRRFKDAFSGGKRLDSPTVSIKPIRRGGGRNSMNWRAMLTLAFLFLVVLSALTVVFFPYGIFRADVEAVIAQSTGRDVSVGDLRGEIYPQPGLVLANVKLGAGKTVLAISEVRLLPELGSLFAPKVKFQRVVLSGVSLPAELIAGLPGVFSSLAAPTSRFALNALRLEATDLSFAGLALSGLEGEARLSAAGKFQGLQLYMPDRSINMEASPTGQGVDVKFDVLAWRPSEASRLVISSGNVKGELVDGVLTMREVEFRVFDGLVKGVAVLRAETTPSLAGEIAYERINAMRLGETLGINQLLAGDASGNLRFSAQAESWATIFAALEAEGGFSLTRGSIRGLDLAEAVRRVSRGPVLGGFTQFEQLSGKILVTNSGYQLSDIDMNSGLMQSSGNVEIGKDKTLRGKLALQMRGSANQMRVPVLLGGTLAVPEVRAGNN